MQNLIRYSMLATLLIGAAAQCADETRAPDLDGDGMRVVAHWPYRALLAGLDTFGDQHALAPDGVLTFALRPAKMAQGATVALDGKEGHQALPLAGARFTLPRIARFDRRDTQVTVAVRDTRAAGDPPAPDPAAQTRFDELGSLPVADVRTPGLPDNVYRLGDLRLACAVSAAVFKDQSPWWFNALLTGILRTTDWCAGANSSTLSPRAAQRFTALTMRDGAREKRLTFDKPRDQLPLPRREQHWSDETLLTIEPASTGDAADLHQLDVEHEP